MAAYALVGKPTQLIDAAAKATGSVKFGNDIEIAGMLFGKALRSPLAHARIRGIDVSRAARAPGVKAVIVARDIPDVKTGAWVKERTVLAVDIVRHMGEPVAAVAAVDEASAEEALALIAVDYEPLPVVSDPETAMQSDAPLVHESLPQYFAPTPRKSYGNVLHQSECLKGDVEAGFKEADVIVEGKYSTQFQHPAYMQPNDAVAQADPQGKITIWCSTKAPFGLRSKVAEALQMPLSKVRIITPHVGGDFGGKSGIAMAPIAALLSRKTGKPVKMVMDWSEEFSGAHVRSRVIFNIKTGARKDGAITALQASIVADVGAYCETIIPFVDVVGTSYGPYHIPNVRTTTYNVHTNNVPTGFVRAPRQPQMMFAIESHVDMLASRLGMDPVELRLKNCFREGEALHDGRRLTNVGLGKSLEKIEEQVQAGTASGRGWGVACAQWSLVPNRQLANRESAAKVVLNEDGTVILVTGVADSGGGQLTVLSQIVGEVLDVPLSRISVVSADTDSCPYEQGTVGSRTTYQVGNTVKQAAEDARSRIMRAAARKLLKDEQELAIKDGRVYSVNSPRDALTFAQIGKEAMSGPSGQIIGFSERRREELFASVRNCPEVVDSPCFGAHAAQVEVDRDTGKVRVLKYVAAHDVGFAINPMAVQAQIQGAVVFGLGYALSEDVKPGNGQDQASSLTDYKLPVAADMPELQVVMTNQPSCYGPYGAKGIGEPPVTPVAAAVANAVFAATGARVTSLPITPEKVLAALRGSEK